MTGTPIPHPPHVLVYLDMPPITQPLLSLGARVTVIVRSLPHRTPSSERERFLFLDGDLPDHAVAAELAAIHRGDPFDAIGCFAEQGHETTSTIATQLGLTYHDLTTSRAIRDKWFMRETLRATGIEDVPCLPVRSAAQLTDAIRSLGFPLILKPVDGFGSNRIHLLSSDEDVQHLAARDLYGDGTQYVAEPVLPGTEISVETFSQGGRHEVLCLTGKYKNHSFVEVGHALPHRHRHEDRVKRYVTRVLDALGVKDGPTHTELFVLPDGTGRMVETHTRFGGGSITRLLQHVYDLDAWRLWARHTMGEALLEEIRAATHASTQHSAVHLISPDTAGTLDAIEGTERALACPGVVQVYAMKRVGSHVEPIRNSSSRTLAVIAVGSTEAEAMTRAITGAGAIHFRVTPAPTGEVTADA